MIRRFWNDERAATAIEYCFIAGFVSILVVVAVTAIGTKLSTKFYAPTLIGLN